MDDLGKEDPASLSRRILRRSRFRPAVVLLWAHRRLYVLLAPKFETKEALVICRPLFRWKGDGWAFQGAWLQGVVPPPQGSTAYWGGSGGLGGTAGTWAIQGPPPWVPMGSLLDGDFSQALPPF